MKKTKSNMKSKIAFKFWAFVFVVTLIQISNIYAQKGRTAQNCVEKKNKQNFCIEIDTAEYMGYYQIQNQNSSTPTGFKKYYNYQNKDKFPLKPGIYRIVVGLEQNIILFKVENDGTINSTNTTALDLTTPKKIKLKTVQIKINPDSYVGEYYFSIFYSEDLYYASGGKYCPYSKNILPSFPIGACPPNRTADKPIDLVSGLDYFVEPHNKGYGGAIFFRVEAIDQSNRIGKVTNISHPSAAMEVNGELKFRNKCVRIFTNEYSGIFYISNLSSENIIKGQPKYFFRVGYIPGSIMLPVNNSDKRFIATDNQVFPNELTLLNLDNKVYKFSLSVVNSNLCR